MWDATTVFFCSLISASIPCALVSIFHNLSIYILWPRVMNASYEWKRRVHSASVMKRSMDLIGLLHIQLRGFTVPLLTFCLLNSSIFDKGWSFYPWSVCVHIYTHVSACDYAWTCVCSLGVAPQELSTLFFEAGLGLTNWAILSGYQAPETGLTLPPWIQAYGLHVVLWCAWGLGGSDPRLYVC